MTDVRQIPVALAHLALFCVSLLYAGNYTVAKLVMPAYVEPSGFIIMRVLAAALLFWLIVPFGPREKIEGKDILRLVICAAFGVAINQLCFFEGLNLTTPIHASLIMTTTPILVLIVAVLAGSERLTAMKIAGVVLGVTGAILLIGISKGGFDLSGGGALGDLLVWINATSYACYLVLVKPLMKKYSPFTVVRWIFTIGIVMVVPFGWEDLTQVDWTAIPTSIWWAIAYVLIGVTFLTYLFNGVALKRLNPSVVSIYIYLQPVLAIIIAILAKSDSLTLGQVGAGLLIFLGIGLVSFAPIKQVSKD